MVTSFIVATAAIFMVAVFNTYIVVKEVKKTKKH